jgi:hypothetical protein
MRHGGDWIWLDGAPGDQSDATLFIQDKDRAGSYMQPADTSTTVSADYDTGELNVKKGGKGFIMYYQLVDA